jgi:16S rRNA (guanine1207-N2)-methyltransferase
MSHYFIHDPLLQRDERIIEYTFNNTRFTFLTNSGLFSYREIDYASELLVSQIPPLDGSLLDLGCGYGFIGIMLGARCNTKVVLTDINPEAVRYAALNSARNNIKTTAFVSDGFSAIRDNFDTIVLNPPIHAGKEIIYHLYAEAYKHLKTKGSFFVVIQKKHGAASHINELKNIFQKCLILYKRKGYYILQGK